MKDDFYYLAWSSVDGAGSDIEHPVEDLQAAIEQADAAQKHADMHGKVWNYTYRVQHMGNFGSRTAYNARTKERR